MENSTNTSYQNNLDEYQLDSKNRNIIEPSQNFLSKQTKPRNNQNNNSNTGLKTPISNFDTNNPEILKDFSLQKIDN